MRKGAKGEKGEKGRKGGKGQKGVRGLRGQHGARGLIGPRGPKVTRADILAAVAIQFKDTHREFQAMSEATHLVSKQLDTQLMRMGQIQAQLDQIHKLVKLILDGVIIEP